MKVIFLSLKSSPLNYLWDLMGFGKITKRIVRELIDKIVVTQNRGKKTYLLKYEEEYIVTTSEIYEAHGLPRYIQTFTEELQQVLHDAVGLSIDNDIKLSSEQSYDCILIQHININEEGSEGQK